VEACDDVADVVGIVDIISVAGDDNGNCKMDVADGNPSIVGEVGHGAASVVGDNIVNIFEL
jgi:hypothetical protein